MTTSTSYTIERIRDEMVADGSHWWDRDTMRSFGTRCIGPVFHGDGGIYFVTSDKEFNGDRSYNVRQYNPATKNVNTVAGVLRDQKSMSRTRALRIARDMSGDTTPCASIPKGDNTPKVSMAEQLLIDLTRAGCNTNLATCRRLIALAKQHHGQCEQCCNGVRDDVSEVLEQTITRFAQLAGCKGVKFQHDPRGCTVKLQLPNGDTNDWGKEGWCVPTR